MMDEVNRARAHADRLDVAVDGQFAGTLTPALRHELFWWTALPLAALALAGLLALLIALMRVPGLEQFFEAGGQPFFERALVVHVTFAFVVWYLGVQGALTVLVTAKDLKQSRLDLAGWGTFVGRAGLYFALASLVMMLVPALAGLGDASANNYVPVIHHPLFYGGLGMLALGVALPVVRLLLLIRAHRTVEPLTLGVAAAGVIFLLAMICIAVAWLQRPDLSDLEAVTDFVFWGGGHVLQFANTSLMLCSFYVVARVALGETPVSATVFKGAMVLLVAGAAAGPLLYLTHAAGDPAQREMFTNLYWFALPVPTAVVMLGMLTLLVRRRADLRDGAPEVAGVVVAYALFAFGGIIGFFEGSVDTRTPGHYHAELIAVTLAFMTLYFALFLPVLGRRTMRRRLRTLMYVLLGMGQFLHSTALYLAGTFGVARKTAGAGQGLDSTEKIISMSAMGLGGVIAVVGGVMFIVLAGSMLFSRHDRNPSASAIKSAMRSAE
jgi:cytochrome c oxidase subunit 1